MKTAKFIHLNCEEKKALHGILCAKNNKCSLVIRARIILLCSEGNQSIDVAKELGISRKTITKWRNRFFKDRMEGLKDKKRLGAPLKYDNSFRLNVLKKLHVERTDGIPWSANPIIRILS